MIIVLQHSLLVYINLGFMSVYIFASQVSQPTIHVVKTCSMTFQIILFIYLFTRFTTISYTFITTKVLVLPASDLLKPAFRF
jgi:hypothetical protein